MAIGQIARARAGQAPETPRPVVALDSAHEVGQLAQPHLDADLVVRLAKNRVFRRAPQPYADRGRPHKHGPVFELQDASTHGPPDRSASLEHPVYGTVMVDAWTRLHVENAPTAPCSVVRVQVEHLPHLGQPMPLWLAWMGGPLPDDLHLVWRWYLRRFSVEHAFRFAKQQLGWTTVRLRSPVAADRWTWLVRRVATLNPFCRRRGSESLPLGQRLTRGRKPNGTGACRRSGTYLKVCGVRSRTTRAPG